MSKIINSSSSNNLKEDEILEILRKKLNLNKNQIYSAKFFINYFLSSKLMINDEITSQIKEEELKNFLCFKMSNSNEKSFKKCSANQKYCYQKCIKLEKENGICDKICQFTKKLIYYRNDKNIDSDNKLKDTIISTKNKKREMIDNNIYNNKILENFTKKRKFPKNAKNQIFKMFNFKQKNNLDEENPFKSHYVSNSFKNKINFKDDSLDSDLKKTSFNNKLINDLKEYLSGINIYFQDPFNKKIKKKINPINLIFFITKKIIEKNQAEFSLTDIPNLYRITSNFLKNWRKGVFGFWKL